MYYTQLVERSPCLLNQAKCLRPYKMTPAYFSSFVPPSRSTRNATRVYMPKSFPSFKPRIKSQFSPRIFLRIPQGKRVISSLLLIPIAFYPYTLTTNLFLKTTFGLKWQLFVHMLFPQLHIPLLKRRCVFHISGTLELSRKELVTYKGLKKKNPMNEWKLFYP